MNRRFGDQPDDVILQNSKHVFDSSIWQLIWPLMNGNTVVIPDRNGLLDLDATIDLIAQHQITMADFVPTIFNFMVEMLSVSSQRISKLTSLRRLLIGGEEINPKAVQKFRRLLPEVGITNTYGPTEASIGMVFHDVDDEDKTNISLGRPIDNTFLFISNEELIALPRGEVGEIVIGGECLGRGYLGEHWKTAFSFPPNPYVNLRVNRLYRTGDLGFIDTKGNLQYKGRSDFQVKVDGVRIEIGEIERCLLDFDQVLEAKVVAQKDGSGRVELTALVSLSQPSNESTLKAELQEHLPESSVPKRILILGEMPVNQNGKIDRQKLLEIAGATSMATAGQNVDFENLNEIEAAVLQSMHEVFERTDIDLDDDFFDLGGDSLRAVTLILLLERRLEQEVAVDVIYRYTTAYSLARGLEQNFEETRSSDNGAAALQKDLEESRAKLATLQSFKSSLASPPTQILLTGATGFVGARVLATLLKTSSAHIHCVVRSHSEEAGIKRLRQTLLAYGLPASIQSERISIVSAELTSMRLGLTPTHWSFLSETIDAVVHSAASVDFMKDYLALRNANVIGTRHLLELALEGKPKSFHHISTLSVFNAHEAKDHRIEEKEWTSDCNFPTDGYSLSKLASEGLVEQAQAMGLKATIYRLGEMMPCSEKGVYNPRAFISRLVSASVQCGIYPDIEMTFDYTPVDVTAKVLCWRIFNSFPDNQIYHLFNPAEADFRLLMEELGSLDLSLRRVSYQDFFKVIKHEIQKPDANNELKALFSALPLPSQSRGKETGSPSFSSVVTPAERFDQRQARQLLQAAGLNWPKFDKHLLTAYARQLAEESLRSQEVLSFN
ncbi:hypothetical protein BCA33_16800 [Marinobacter sp. AC-23]|nr:hypothetical protein BCA33_16800 [Marinobacter sp. AC-23]